MQSLPYAKPRPGQSRRAHRRVVLVLLALACAAGGLWMAWERSVYTRARFRLSEIDRTELEALQEELSPAQVAQLMVSNPKVGLRLLYARSLNEDDMLAVSARAAQGDIRSNAAEVADIMRLWFHWRGNRDAYWRGTPRHLARRDAFKGLFQSANSPTERQKVLLQFIHSEGVVYMPPLSTRLERAENLEAIFREEWDHTARWIAEDRATMKAMQGLPKTIWPDRRPNPTTQPAAH